MISRTSLVLGGGLFTLLFTVPAVLIARVAWGDEEGATGQLVVVAVAFFFTGFGGFFAAQRDPETPLRTGALVGLVCFVGTQLAASLASGEAPNPAGAVVFAMLFMSVGTIGAFVANARGARTATSEDRGR